MTIENVSPSFQAKENAAVRTALTPLPEPHITGMKLLGDVALGSLVLNIRSSNGVIWVCTDIENWWTPAEPDYPRIEKSFGDGSYDVSGRYQQRELTLEGSILVPDPRLAPSARSTLVAALDLVYQGTWLKAVESQGGTHTAVSASLTDNVATIALSSIHSFQIGDLVTISGSSVNTYNGTYQITGVSGNTFTFSKTNANLSQQTIQATATVSSLTKAAWVRLAGKPDIDSRNARGRLDFSVDLVAPDPVKYYWSSATDGFETASLTPKNTSTSATGTHSVFNRGNTRVGVELAISGRVVGPLTIKNTTTNQTLTVTSPIVASGGTTNITRKGVTGGQATLTTSGPHGLYVGKQVTVAGVDSIFNGTRTVSAVPASNKFSFPLSYGSTVTFDSYQVGKSVAISTRAIASGVATVTTSSAHGFVAGMEVYVAGITGLTGLFTISSVPDSTRFTFTTSAADVASSSVTGASALGNIVTLSSAAAFTYIAGEIISVSNMDPAVNASNVSIISVSADKKSLTYAINRAQAVKTVSYDPSEQTAGTDVVTLTTWGQHGVRVGDTVYVQGCGRPINNDVATSVIAATATSVTDFSISYTTPTVTKTISGLSLSAVSGGKYRVTVTTSAAGTFQTGDLLKMRAVQPGGTQPVGINGTFTMTRVNNTTYYYEVKPPSTTKSGLTEYFGAAAPGPISISSQRNNYLAFADIVDQPVNTANTQGVGGRVVSFAIIPTTSKQGSSYSDYIEDTAATGTVTYGGDTLTLNTRDRSAYLNTSSEYARGKLAAVTDWVELAPGANTIEVSDAGSATSTATVTMKYRSGWLA